MDTFRCELTPDRLDRGERELAAALSLAAIHTQEAMRARRERREPRVRALGLVMCALGAVGAGWSYVMLPLYDCPAAAARFSGRALFYQSTTVAFVVLGVLFWFLPRIGAELRAWAPGAAARAAPRVLAPLRRQLPSEVSYELGDGAIRSTLARPPRTSRTLLGAVRVAIVGADTACLFGPPPFGRLVRLVWLPDDAARRAVVAALDDTKVPVVALERPASGPERSTGAV